MNAPIGGVIPPIIFAAAGPIILSANNAFAAIEAVLFTGPPKSNPIQNPITPPIMPFAPPFNVIIHAWNFVIRNDIGIENTQRNIIPHTRVEIRGINITGIRP
ncbi:hypothetical protein [Lacrimispora xylanisolvens]|uniref:hypothetical protein n=1 Tax=Lacrimispora xylanisolvens TaxID=384636 RepID=UPI0024029D47